MTRVVFIRHAEPVLTDGMPPAEWPLSEQGRSDARELGIRLADGTAAVAVWTSPERKARETTSLAFPSAVPRVRKELSEVKRAWYASPDELAGAVAAYLRGDVVDGWENRDDLIARLASLEADFAPWERVVVVRHGVLLTTWLHHEIGLEDPYRFWSDLRMPDAWQLDLEEESLERMV